jgi:hypothetical protein
LLKPKFGPEWPLNNVSRPGLRSLSVTAASCIIVLELDILSVLFSFRIAASVFPDAMRSYRNIFWRTFAGSVVPRMLSAAISVAYGFLSYVQVSVIFSDAPAYSAAMVLRNEFSWMWVLRLAVGRWDHLTGSHSFHTLISNFITGTDRPYCSRKVCLSRPYNTGYRVKYPVFARILALCRPINLTYPIRQLYISGYSAYSCLI